MSASTHVIFRVSENLSKKLRAVGDSSMSESLRAKQMVILAVNELDSRHIGLILQLVSAMEEAYGKSARSRQNDLIEPFEKMCNIIKCKVDAACVVVGLDDNERAKLIYKISKELSKKYRKLSLKTRLFKKYRKLSLKTKKGYNKTKKGYNNGIT